MSVLSLRNLGKRYGEVDALAGLDLDVAPGSRTAIVGPSGSGKTTLLRLVAGFEVPDSGEIMLDGQRIADPEAGLPAHRRNIGLVMQEGALFPHLTIAQNIGFGIRHQPDAEAQALKLMDLVELDCGMAHRQPHQLSGGQQQRVALARALARKPRLMLLDEPFSALDTGLRVQLRRATASILSEAGIATVLVTHDQEEAMSFADQLVVLRQGRLVQAGSPRELYLHPRDPATAEFLGPAILLEAGVNGGMAATPFGPLAAAGPDGPAQLLLRPEQLTIAAGPSPWTLVAIEHVGPNARVTVTGPETLSFETASRALPAPGSPVAIGVSGTAHRFA